MRNFHCKAYFWKDKVLIEGQAYQNNAILTACLNFPAEQLKKWLVELRSASQQVSLKEGGDKDFCQGYDDAVRRAQSLLDEIDRAAEALPPYGGASSSGGAGRSLLGDCLNEYYLYWEAGKGLEHFNDPGFNKDGFSNDYGFIVKLPDGSYNFYVQRFLPDWQDLTGKDPNTLLMIRRTNAALRKLFDPYISFIQEVQRAQGAYLELLEYFHEPGKYLTDEELADCYSRYLAAGKKPGDRVAELGPLRVRQEVCVTHGGNAVLCDAYEFENLQTFLHMDFFRGLYRGDLPKRCSNCGRFFLLAGGKYTNYCHNPLKDDPERTCRDVGARKKYDDKCKSDPVWLTYNRAYKAHYARYMKKRMTLEEFERWSARAVELRGEAERGDVSMEDYAAEIRK